MQFIGQSHITSFFDLALNEQQMGLSYCFVGPNQIGKRTLANWLASQILNVEIEKLLANPDYYYLTRLEDEKTGKKKKDISAEQTRELKEKLYNRSWLNGHKVAIIDEAELLNEESGNALLKILEEPPQKCSIFLLTENDASLLPTIRSRCQVFQFVPVDDKEIENFLEKESIDKDKIKEAIGLSWGRPGKAKELLENKELFDQYRAEKKRWQKIVNAPIYERWQIMDDVLSEKGGVIKTKEKLDPILDCWIMLWRGEMLEDEKKSVHSQTVIDEIKNIKNLLATNVNPRLAIESLLTKF